MPSGSPHRAASSPQRALRVFVLLIAIAVVAGAVWIAGAAAIESTRFANGTNQILQLVAGARTLASRDKNFAAQPNEDVLAELTRAGLLTGTSDAKPATLGNPWKGVIRALTPAPAAMRIETDVPSQDCRRMALFLFKNGGDLGLTMLEARGEGRPSWQRFFAPTEGINVANNRVIEDACDQGSNVTLALVFAVR